mgnify:CR=1 FL=1
MSVNNIDYSYYSLKQLLKPRSKEFLKKTKLKEKTYSVEINDIAEKFEKSNLTQDEIKDYFFRKKESKAKSWFSSQRSLRKIQKYRCLCNLRSRGHARQEKSTGLQCCQRKNVDAQVRGHRRVRAVHE